MKRTLSIAAALLAGITTAATAQTPPPTPTPTTFPSGVTHATENAARVNGVRIDPLPDGSVWFLEASADRIAVLRGSTITHWQLRLADQLGANPVDFELDGDTVWFIESGQSEIPAGTSAFASLDTTTGELTEYVIPGSIPAGFYRAPDGKVWIAQSSGRLQVFDPATLQVVDYRSILTFAYADMVVGPDGALWMVDFGNNRIVRYVPGEATERTWVFFTGGRLNPAQIEFDDRGYLWISQFSGGRMDRFDPATGELLSYFGIANPLHFDIFQGRLYVTPAQTQSAVSVLDPGIAVPGRQVLSPVTLDVGSAPNPTAVTIRTSTITPTTFESPAVAIPSADLAVTSSAEGPGLLTFTFPSTNNYGIAVDDGQIWVGTDGKLANLVLQTVGSTSDLAVPVATALAGPAESKIRVDITLSNLGADTISGDALYLFSPGASAARVPFTLEAGRTLFLPDAFGNLASVTQLLNGPIRLRVTSGNASDLAASIRSTRVLPGGGTFGYAIPAAPVSAGLTPGSTSTLFTGSRESEVSILGLYAPGGASGVLTLLSPDGTTRGVRAFDLATNVVEEFNPAASAFGVGAEPGDVVRVSVVTGNVQAYVNVLDLGTLDVATSPPVAATADAVIPNAGAVIGAAEKSFVSDLFLSNPDPDTTAEISLAYYPLGVGGPPDVAAVSLGPDESRSIADLLPTLFGIPSGQGSLLITSNVAVASAVRIASRSSSGDYAAFAAALAASAAIPDGGSAIAIGVPQTATRRTNLVLYNRGFPGSVTVTGFRADGTEAGSIAVPLGDHAPGRLDSVFATLGITDQPAGRIRIDAPEGMKVYAWTVEVDGFTGDLDIAPLR